MSAARTGLTAQLGFGEETVYGMDAVPNRFLPFIDETLDLAIDRLESKAIIAGQTVLRSAQWAPGKWVVGGDVKFELTNRGLLLLLKHCMGAIATTGTGPYTSVFTPDPSQLAGLGLTFQKGVPDVNTGFVHPLTFTGCKVSKWEIAGKAGEIATFGVTVAGQAATALRTVTDAATFSASANLASATAAFTQADVGTPVVGTGIPALTTILSITTPSLAVMSAPATVTGTGVSVTIGSPLATATYPAAIYPFTFVQGNVTIAGTKVPVDDFTFTGENALKSDRFKIAGSPLIAEPLLHDLRKFSGTLNMDFLDRTQYNRYLSGAEFSLVLNFTNAAGDSINMTSNIRYEPGLTPKVKGRDVVSQAMPFKAIAPAADSDALSITVVNQDATP